MILWTEQAIQQLDQAHDYIALSNSEKVAAQVTARIVTSVQQLTTFPMSGRPGRVRGIRELVISNSPS
jgi:plasmid stabilization system protein ParE